MLVNGAGGGAGTFAIQLAARAGAHVTAVDNAGKLDYLSELGADAVVDYRSSDFTRLEPYDLVLDLAAHRSVFACRRTGRRLRVLAVRQGPARFEPAAELCIAGDLRIHIDRTFTLDEVPHALAYVGEGRALGKVVVTP
ncbi:zinc-binding dehydrogenase [Marisediminicola antarctica]|uniref:zinc-binding dehydrogenase n=1 Tax=Marisediminicola antarctica TaxID=674079 RepID=UPI00192A3891|nr:zinc-binding dehydrogenase [Marisediminicola antarctica]